MVSRGAGLDRYYLGNLSVLDAALNDSLIQTPLPT